MAGERKLARNLTGPDSTVRLRETVAGRGRRPTQARAVKSSS